MLDDLSFGPFEDRLSHDKFKVTLQADRFGVRPHGGARRAPLTPLLFDSTSVTWHASDGSADTEPGYSLTLHSHPDQFCFILGSEEQYQGIRERVTDHIAVYMKKRVFCEPLDSICERDGVTVPVIVTEIMEFLMTSKADEEEGIFRVSGHMRQIEEYRKMYNQGETVCLLPDESPHTVAALLKLYLRSIPRPIIPPTEVIACVAKSNPPTPADVASVLAHLPLHARTLVEVVFVFLARVAQKHATTLMTARNLSLIFHPCVLAAVERPPAALAFLEVLIQEYDSVLAACAVGQDSGCSFLKDTP